MAPSIPGFVLTWAPVPTGRAPHTRARPVAASCRVPRIRRSLLRPVIAGGAFQPISLLPGKAIHCCPGWRDPFAKCRFRYTRAQGSEAVAWCAQGCPPPRRGGGGPVEQTFSGRPKGRPPGRERQLRRHGSRPPPGNGGRGASRRHAGGLRPCTQSASPGGGLAVVRSGAFSSAWAPAGLFLRGAVSATGARPVLARTSLDHRAAGAARSLSSP